MAWIRLVHEDEAEGQLRRLYDDMIRYMDEGPGASLRKHGGKGRVSGVIKSFSLRPRVLARHTPLFREIMFGGDAELSRQEREMLATVVSRENECWY